MREIVGRVWFTDSFGTIGIVIVKLDTKEEKAYIGHGFGRSEIADVWHIADWGSSFPLKEAQEIIKEMGMVTSYAEGNICNMWWGYLHSNGSIQVKRWFGDHKDYQDDCYGNDFVVQVVPPFAADSREEAIKIIKIIAKRLSKRLSLLPK